MDKSVNVFCINNSTNYKVAKGSTLLEIAAQCQPGFKNQVLGALVNNTIRDLAYEVYKPKDIEFFDISDTDGMRMYVRSLSFVLYKACSELYPNNPLVISHSISKGLYCELEGIENIDVDVAFSIIERMRAIVDACLPFERTEIPTAQAVELYRTLGLTDKVKLFTDRDTPYSSVYFLDGQPDYFYGYLLPHTGYLKNFDLVKYYHGMLLVLPKRSNPIELEYYEEQDKLFDIFKEYKSWANILGIKSVGSLNETIKGKQVGELIKISEALHEKKVARIADEIVSRPHVRFVFIAGPSSSGKTTFSMRLGIQLKVLGKRPIEISLDNYFVNREETPRDEHGEYDFESIDAIDIKLFNQNLLDLLAGQEVEVPSFSFDTGKRFFSGRKFKANAETIFIIEGIHALNPKLSNKIALENKFRIYISALTQLAIDKHNRIPSTDNRLIRRIVRDFQYRSYSATATLNRWASVRRGEEQNIFPFQEEADIMFNSALLYELGVLKTFAEPILRQVSPSDRVYAEAKRLLKFLGYFREIPMDEIPPTSILREFLKGSTFSYH